MLPPFAVNVPVAVSRLTPLPGLPEDETVLNVTPPLNVVDVTFTAAPPEALTVLVVPPMASVPPVLATRPAPAVVVIARDANDVVALLSLVSDRPVPLLPMTVSPNEKVADPTALVMLMPAAAPA